MSRSWFPGKPRKAFQKTRISVSFSQNNETDLETNKVLFIYRTNIAVVSNLTDGLAVKSIYSFICIS